MLNLNRRADLQQIVDDSLRESLTLEFKDSRALSKSNDGRSELIKDVSAFANSAGGQIVYGIRERNGVAFEVDSGVDRSKITSEWIEQVIDTNTSPRIQGVVVTPIITNDFDGSVAYVLTIPQSSTFAPHQNLIDNKYYKRFELRSVPMADFEIRDTMLRKNKAILQVNYYFDDDRSTVTEIDGPNRVFTIMPVLSNLSTEPSLYSIFEFLFDARIKILKGPDDIVDKRTTEIWGRRFRSFQKKLSIPNDFPLVDTIDVTLKPEKFLISLPDDLDGENSTYLIAYQAVAAPGSTTNGYQIIRVQDGRLHLENSVLVTKDRASMLPPIVDDAMD